MPKIDLSGWEKLKERINAALYSHVQVGVLASQGGDDTTEDGFSIIELAAVHEFGAPAAGIPERSFIRKTFEIKKEDLHRVVGDLMKQVIEDKLTVEKALNILGLWGATEIKKTITDELVTPKLMDSEAGQRTAARKGSTKTLVDTGRLLNSISYEVQKR